MEVITKYITVDGREFENEWEAKCWEYMVSHVPEQIIFHAEDGTWIEANNPTEVEKAIDDCKYIEIVDFEGNVFPKWKDAINFLDDYFGMITINLDEPGFYAWNKECCGWDKAEEK